MYAGTKAVKQIRGGTQIRQAGTTLQRPQGPQTLPGQQAPVRGTTSTTTSTIFGRTGTGGHTGTGIQTSFGQAPISPQELRKPIVAEFKREPEIIPTEPITTATLPKEITEKLDHATQLHEQGYETGFISDKAASEFPQGAELFQHEVNEITDQNGSVIFTSGNVPGGYLFDLAQTIEKKPTFYLVVGIKQPPLSNIWDAAIEKGLDVNIKKTSLTEISQVEKLFKAVLENTPTKKEEREIQELQAAQLAAEREQLAAEAAEQAQLIAEAAARERAEQERNAEIEKALEETLKEHSLTAEELLTQKEQKELAEFNEAIAEHIEQFDQNIARHDQAIAVQKETKKTIQQRIQELKERSQQITTEQEKENIQREEQALLAEKELVDQKLAEEQKLKEKQTQLKKELEGEKEAVNQRYQQGVREVEQQQAESTTTTEQRAIERATQKEQTLQSIAAAEKTGLAELSKQEELEKQKLAEQRQQQIAEQQETKERLEKENGEKEAEITQRTKDYEQAKQELEAAQTEHEKELAAQKLTNLKELQEAAEKELSELKETREKLDKELAELKEQQIKDTAAREARYAETLRQEEEAQQQAIDNLRSHLSQRRIEVRDTSEAETAQAQQEINAMQQQLQALEHQRETAHQRRLQHEQAAQNAQEQLTSTTKEAVQGEQLAASAETIKTEEQPSEQTIEIPEKKEKTEGEGDAEAVKKATLKEQERKEETVEPSKEKEQKQTVETITEPEKIPAEEPEIATVEQKKTESLPTKTTHEQEQAAPLITTSTEIIQLPVKGQQKRNIPAGRSIPKQEQEGLSYAQGPGFERPHFAFGKKAKDSATETGWAGRSLAGFRHKTGEKNRLSRAEKFRHFFGDVGEEITEEEQALPFGQMKMTRREATSAPEVTPAAEEVIPQATEEETPEKEQTTKQKYQKRVFPEKTKKIPQEQPVEAGWFAKIMNAIADTFSSIINFIRSLFNV